MTGDRVASRDGRVWQRVSGSRRGVIAVEVEEDLHPASLGGPSCPSCGVRRHWVARIGWMDSWLLHATNKECDQNGSPLCPSRPLSDELCDWPHPFPGYMTMLELRYQLEACRRGAVLWLEVSHG